MSYSIQNFRHKDLDKFMPREKRDKDIIPFLEYKDALKWFCLKRSKSMNMAEDVVAMTYSKAYRSLHTFKEGTNRKTWLYAIARNTIIDYWRHQKTKNEVYDDSSPNNDLKSFDDTCFVSDSFVIELENEEFNKLIRKSIDKLPDIYRDILYARLDGYSYAEIEKKFKISEGIVKSRLWRAKKLLSKNRNLIKLALERGYIPSTQAA